MAVSMCWARASSKDVTNAAAKAAEAAEAAEAAATDKDASGAMHGGGARPPMAAIAMAAADPGLMVVWRRRWWCVCCPAALLPAAPSVRPAIEPEGLAAVAACRLCGDDHRWRKRGGGAAAAGEGDDDGDGRRPGLPMRVLNGLGRLRKHLVYALASVHSADGQLVLYQVMLQPRVWGVVP
jgi:hypothetical protein